MTHNSLRRSAERFETLFGEGSPDRQGLPRALRETIYARMQYAFMATDEKKFKSIKTHFLKTFHPDSPDSVFTKDERNAVFVTIPYIFEGGDLS